jgi:hypothetical protein
MKNRLLQIFVYGFSFLFTAYFVAGGIAVICAVFAPFARNHFLQYAIILLPLPFGIYAGLGSAKVALKLERKRQEKTQRKRLGLV